MKMRGKPFCFHESLRLGISDMTHFLGRLRGKGNRLVQFAVNLPPGVLSLNSPILV
jgi:hypothetical protein